MRVCRALLVLTVALLASVASAAVHEVRVPLDHGVLRFSQLASIAAEKVSIHLSVPSIGHVNLNSVQGSLFLGALEKSLDGGCSVHVQDDQLILHFDTSKLPRSIDGAKKVTRIFTAEAAPEATAAQGRFFGLHLPPHVHPDQPLTILIHGLDCDPANFESLAQLLKDDGQQVANFVYPSDQPLADSAATLQEHLAAVHETWPAMPVHIIAHSMGALVTRQAIESDDYPGGVKRLIMIAPPNHGSKWARFRVFLELEEHYHLWKHVPQWKPTWMITDGLGEAGRDLKPGSQFLTQLNARSRRDGVRYTIIAGDRSEVRRHAADILESPTHWLSPRVQVFMHLTRASRAVSNFTEKIRSKSSNTDGPVTIASTRLDGVDDFVIVHGDHDTLYASVHGNPPVAWPAIRERLN